MPRESEQIEYKASLAEKEDGGECLVSFANKDGGVLYFGIENNGQIKGIPQISEKTIRELSQLYVDNTEPKLTPTITIEEKSGVEVIKISINKSTTPYHTFRKKPFIRVASETRNMPQPEYQRRLVVYQKPNQDYSSKTIGGGTFDHLSVPAIQRLRELLVDSGRTKVNIVSLTDEQLLRDLRLYVDGKITIAALVLLGTSEAIQSFLPYVEIRYCYKTNEHEPHAQDIEIFTGGYLLYYREIWQKINSRNLSLSIPKGLLIQEVKAFEEGTIREALNNAVAHRDYSLNESVFVTQYQTKIDIKSPGGFVDGVTPQNILDESKTRNKLIADTLFKCGFVEHLGNGVNLMFKNQLSRGKNPPNYYNSTANAVFLELDGKIKDIEFAKYVFNVAHKKSKDLSDKELILLNQIKDGKRVRTSETTENLLQLGLIESVGYGKFVLSKAYYEALDKSGEYTRNRGLSRNAHKLLILEHLNNYEKGFKRDLEQALPGTPWSTIYRLLIELRNEGKIEFVGNRRSYRGDNAGHWKVK